MVPIHPGRFLKRELAARGMSDNQLALALRVPLGARPGSRRTLQMAASSKAQRMAARSSPRTTKSMIGAPTASGLDEVERIVI